MDDEPFEDIVINEKISALYNLKAKRSSRKPTKKI